METESSQVLPKTKRAAATKKKPVVTISESEDEIEDDDDGSMEVSKPAAAAKKGGRKPAAAASKLSKPPAGAAKKRGPSSKAVSGIGQKLLTEMLKPATESTTGVSPEKKVRRMRASPFNKKSSSVLGKTATSSSNVGGSGDGSVDSGGAEENQVAAVPKARPQRARRQLSQYVLSDSEDEEEVNNISSDSEVDLDDSESDEE